MNLGAAYVSCGTKIAQRGESASERHKRKAKPWQAFTSDGIVFLQKLTGKKPTLIFVALLLLLVAKK